MSVIVQADALRRRPNPQSEVTEINKQKFLAELAKLLTFMYEEDRQTALAMYSKMFEDAENEQALLQTLISPTRQAVVIARSYNAKERRLQVTSTSREDGDEADRSGTPEFMLAIHRVYEAFVLQNGGTPAALEDQFSLFEEESHQADTLFEETFPVVQEIEEVPQPAAAPVQAEAVVLEEPELPDEAAAEDEPEEKEAPAEPVESASIEDAFLSDFSIEDAEEEPEEKPVVKAAPAPVEAQAPIAGTHEELSAILDATDAKPQATVREPRIFLLILFIILAVPITLAGIILLLIPTVLFLVLAVGVIGAGAVTLIAAFGSGFTVFADILVVIGLAIIILALGLLFLWLFIWFIGGAIVGLVRGVMALGGKWCYKEVTV